MKMACPSFVVSPSTDDGQNNLLALSSSHSRVENRTRAKMASRAANSVVRRLAHRNIDWCVSWVRDLGRKRCGDWWEGWSNRRLGSATSNGKSVGSARGFVLSCTEKRPPLMEMASPASKREMLGKGRRYREFLRQHKRDGGTADSLSALVVTPIRRRCTSCVESP